MGIDYFDAVICNNAIYCLTRIAGLFVKISMDNYEVEYIHPDGIDNIDTIYSTVCAAKNNTVYGLCKSGKYLICYNTEKDELLVNTINMEKYYLDWVLYAEVINDELVIIGNYTNGILFINVKSGQVKRQAFIDESGLEINGTFDKKVITNSSIVLFDTKDNIVVCINKNDFKTSINHLSTIQNAVSFTYTGTHYLMLNKDGCLYELYFESEIKYKKIMELSEQICADNFGESIYENGQLWIMPHIGAECLHIDIENNKYKLYHLDISENISDKGARSTCTSLIRCNDGKMLFGIRGTNLILCIKNKCTDFSIIELDIDSKKMIKEYKKRKIMKFSENEFNLGDYIEYICD